MNLKNKLIRVGVVGGMGPQTSFSFCLNLNNKFRKIMHTQPDIILENLPLSKKSEQELISGKSSPQHFQLMLHAIQRLHHADVDFIVIPCNTVHIFIDELRKRSHKPILSIIEETALICREKNLQTIGLLGTTKTITEALHQQALEKIGITSLILPQKDQEHLNTIIINIINATSTTQDQQALLKMINTLQKSGAQAIILACTDLTHLIQSAQSPLPLIDTCSVLENATLKCLIEG